ncbi:hypothetical protein A9R04_26060 [Nocardiopsis dassonvillei]|nr:hypothetical protein A9R04_26060 [Nocardiopsis dassonvillei]
MSTGDVPNTLLHVLQCHYAQQWSIRRHGGLWIATATRQQITHAPTLIEEDVEVFVHQLEYPPPGIGNSELSSERLRASESRAETGLQQR